MRTHRHAGSRFTVVTTLPRRVAVSVIAAAVIFAAVISLLGGVAQASVVTHVFSTAGCSVWTVPSPVTSLQVRAVGAAGDTGGAPPGDLAVGTGGKGDAVSGTMPVSPGDPITVCVDYGGAAGGDTDGVDGGGGGGASMAADIKDSNVYSEVVAGGGGGGGTSGGPGFITGDGGNAGYPDGGNGTGPGGSDGAGGSDPPGPAAVNQGGLPTNATAESGWLLAIAGQGGGVGTQGAGGGGGGGVLPGGGGGWDGLVGVDAIGDGGGGGGSDYCMLGTVTTGCTIDSAAGTVHGAGTAPGDAEVVLTYDLPNPTISITTPANGASYALDQNVTENFSCSDPSGISSCSNQVGENSGATLPTFLAGTYSLTVTAVANDGSTATKTVTYTVGEPSESITTPVAGATYLENQSVPTSFSCADAPGAPGLTATGGCVDQNGNPSGTALDTSTPGAHTYTVTATSQDGLSTSSSVTYYVADIQIARPDPSGDSIYTQGQQVAADFICTIPGYNATCVDANGNPYGNSMIDTSAAGQHTFKVFASVGGGPSAELDVTYDVQAPQTISWAQQGPLTYGHPVLLDATASSGISVTYSVVSGPCAVTAELAGTVLTESGAGSCVIDANQAGDGLAYAPAPTVQQTITVDKAVMHVDANSVTTTYGTKPTLTYTLRASDFVKGDTPSSIGLTGSPLCTSSAGRAPKVGRYPGAITCNPSGMSSPNYTFVAGNSGVLTVTAAPIVSIHIDPGHVSLPLGSHVKVVVIATDSNGTSKPLTSGFTLTTSNRRIVTIHGDELTAVGRGRATLTATDGKLTATARVAVTRARIRSLTLRPLHPRIRKGRSIALRLTGIRTNHTTIDLTDKARWSTRNRRIATVNKHGVVTAIARGTVVIEAVIDGHRVSVRVTVVG